MEGRERPHVEKYEEIMNVWNYDTSCTLTSLPVLNFENFKCLIFVAWEYKGFQVKLHLSRSYNGEEIVMKFLE
jgi:hypothetical protein